MITKKNYEFALICAFLAFALVGCHPRKTMQQKPKVIVPTPKITTESKPQNTTANKDKKTFEEISDKAKNGDAGAQLALSKVYATGAYSVEKNDTHAFYWLKKSLDQDYPDAQVVMGRWYAKGRFVGKDSEKSIYWLEQAANNGCPYIQTHLASTYFFGRDVKQDDKKAFYWAKKAIDDDVPYAKEQFEFFQSIVDALKTFNKYKTEQIVAKAEKGDVNFQVVLGIMYATGHNGVKLNNTMALKWFLKAASQGDASAQYFVANHYEHSRNPEPDYEKVIFWLSKAANQGHARAQHRLSEFYLSGQGIDKNEEQALNWLKKSVEQEYADYKIATNKRNDKNLEIRKSFEKAIYWYEKVAEKESAGILEKQCAPNKEAKN